MARWKLPWRNWSRRHKVLSAFLGVLLLIVADYWLYPVVAPVGGSSKDQGRNGIWLRYKWYFGEEQDYVRLAEQLRSGGFRYAFFHVRSINREGNLEFRYAERAQQLNRQVKRLAPDTLRIAWILAENRSARGPVDLSSASVRRKMVSEAVWLVREGGFDGIQWDYEYCPNLDPSFLKLLEETREALPETFLSVTAPTHYPWPFSGAGWTSGYYYDVGKRVDQVAVMAYDTGLYFPRLYVMHLQGNMTSIGRAIQWGNPNCRLLMGVPTYGPAMASHNPRAENLKIALKALREADGSDAFEGLAIFADYTTDQEEWELYRELWRRPWR